MLSWTDGYESILNSYERETLLKVCCNIVQGWNKDHYDTQVCLIPMDD